MPLLYSILILIGFIAVAVGFFELVKHSLPIVLTVIGIIFLSLWGIGAIIMITKKLIEWQRENKREEEELIRLKDEVATLKRKLTEKVIIQGERKKKDT